jgi:hypothetical protein
MGLRVAQDLEVIAAKPSSDRRHPGRGISPPLVRHDLVHEDVEPRRDDGAARPDLELAALQATSTFGICGSDSEHDARNHVTAPTSPAQAKSSMARQGPMLRSERYRQRRIA